uniref:Uncharacterized protein n=1 Tax=Navicula veneta TaxID=138539 RepID=A0A8F1B8J2_9STRA|nr:hypothetical protein KYX03_pgp024 [Navicula veneta]QWM93805.1 hypothetical protein [Navicula veneta]
MKFNKKHYRELLQYSQNLRNLDEMPDDMWDQLSKYSAILWKHLDWEMKEIYADLMAKFLNGEISEGILKIEFVRLQKSQEQVHKSLESNLIILSTTSNPNLDNIADLISDLQSVLEEFAVESTFSLKDLQQLVIEKKYAEVEKQKKFQNYELIKEIYSNLKTYLDD